MLPLEKRRKAEQRGKRALKSRAEFSLTLVSTLNSLPHYMMCDSDIKEQRHGLGLLIVRQIAASHGGSMILRQSACGGFGADILLPLYTGQSN